MGRPRRSKIVVLQSKLWYLDVRRRCDWSDYRLDLQFGQEEGPGKVKGEARTRVFGALWKRGSLPSRGDHRRRQFDLVARVDSHHLFRGTKATIDSLFWELLCQQPRDVFEMRRFVERCCERLGLRTLTGTDAFIWSWLTSQTPPEGSLKSTGAGAYEQTLQRATKDLEPSLDLIALYGVLYREACLSFALESAEIAAVYFKLTLAEYFDMPWTNPIGAEIKDIAINRIIHGIADYLPTTSDKDVREQHSRLARAPSVVVSTSDPLLSELGDHRAALAPMLKG